MSLSRIRRGLWVGVGVLAVGSGFVIATRRPAAPPLPTSSALATNTQVDPGTVLTHKAAPAFTLTDQFGKDVSLSSYRGQVVLLAFIDSQCTTVCPLTSMEMDLARRMLGPAGRRVALVAIDANPAATSVADVKAYSAAHGLTHDWAFLTGSKVQLEQVWKRYDIYVGIEQGQIDHTPALYLIDGHGDERRVYLTQMAYAAIGQQAQVLARAAADFLPSHPKVRSALSYETIPGISPTATTILPGVDGPSVTLKAGRAHVLVFFATWAAGTSRLKSEFASLGQYAARAKQDGLPEPVAVDELPTEASRAVVRTFMRSLGVKLDYPVVLDTNGRLADGYGVQGIPWTTMTSRAGRVVAHYDGWLSPAALATRVHRTLSGSSA